MRRWSSQAGSAIPYTALGSVLTLLAIVALLETAAFLAAVSRAQALADQAALAAVASGQPGVRPGVAPDVTARAVVRQHDGASLLSCDCSGRPVEVAVAVRVGGLLVHRLGIGDVVAKAQADLTSERGGRRVNGAVP